LDSASADYDSVSNTVQRLAHPAARDKKLGQLLEQAKAKLMNNET